MFNKFQMLFVSLMSAMPCLIFLYVKNKLKQNCSDEDDQKQFFHCNFVNVKNFECKKHVFKNYKCSDNCSTKYIEELLNFLNSAKKSISLCMYIVTLESVLNALVNAHKNGIKVRVICDNEMARQTSSISKQLRKQGIPVKTQPIDDSLMHHKFCLIDESDREFAKLFYGSTNLTLQGFTFNWDQIIYTNKFAIIKRFSEEFEYLWQEFQFIENLV